MKMRTRTLYRLLAPLLLTVACDDAGPLPETDGEDRTRLHIQVRGVAPGEDLQVFTFDTRAPQNIAGYSHSNGSFTSFETTAGDKIVSVVLNGPDLSAIADFSSLMEWHYVPGVADIPSTLPLRFGLQQVRVSQNTHEIRIDAGLQLGRVGLISVVNRLDGHQTIDSLQAYLANAAGDNLLGFDYLDSALRIHPGGSSAPEPSSPLANTSLGALPYGSAHIGPYYLYSCPTPPDWEPWLVLAARISGERWYYSIPLSGIEKGLSQEVSVTLRTLGADQPCIAGQPGSYDLTQTPTAWTIHSSTEHI